MKQWRKSLLDQVSKGRVTARELLSLHSLVLNLLACTLVHAMTFGLQRQRRISSGVHTILKGSKCCASR